MLAAAKARTQGAAEVVDSLLRAGAEEAIVNNSGGNVSDLIGMNVEEEEEEGRLAEDILRVHDLLASAPADKTWRRRGYLALCRAHPNRAQQNQMMISGTNHTDTARRTRSRATPARAGEIGEDSIRVGEGTGGD